MFWTAALSGGSGRRRQGRGPASLPRVLNEAARLALAELRTVKLSGFSMLVPLHTHPSDSSYLPFLPVISPV